MVLKLFEIPFLPFGTELRNMIPSHTKHYDGTVKKLSGTFRLTHTVNNSLYGEFIMYSCSTVLKNNYSAKYATSTMSTFCAKTTYILLCVICFCILIITSRLFKFFFVQLLRAISFVKFISRNMVCSI